MQTPSHKRFSLTTPLAVILHTVLWCAFFALLYFRVQKLKSIFDGFDVEVPSSTMLVIDISTLLFGYPFVVPLLLILGVAVDTAVLSSLNHHSSEGLRLTWFCGMVAIPVAMTTFSFYALAVP